MNIFWFAPLVIVSAISVFIWSRTPQGRLTIAGLMLKFPLAGRLMVQLAVAQAARDGGLKF